MSIRTFSLNSREFYEAVCEPEERPRIPNGALPRAPRWPRRSEGAWVSAGDEDAAGEAVRVWRRHVEAGKIGSA